MSALLTASDVAAIVYGDPSKVDAIYRFTRLRVIPAVRIGRIYRYDPEAIREFIRAGGARTPEEALRA